MNALSTLDLRTATRVRSMPIHDFVERHSLALRNAAQFLDGSRAVAELERLFCDLAGSTKIGVHTRRRLDRLIGLLELDDDVVSDSHVLYEINPSDPIFEELCLLLDGLKDALRQATVVQLAG